MIDDEEMPEPHKRDGVDGYLYDYFKYLTSLALLTLGGVLTLSESASDKFSKYALTAVLILVAASGVLAFSGASEIVRAKSTGTGHRHLELMRKAAPALLGAGIGVFLYIFRKKLSGAS
jgi:hypothetical protein